MDTGVHLGDAIRQSRDFMGNRFVYAVVSQRAGGLSIGINMNPDQSCNFDCVYCEVARKPSYRNRKMDVSVLGRELKNVFRMIQHGRLQEVSCFRKVPPDLMILKNVDLSGDGEPTYSADFSKVVQAVIQLREAEIYPSFKMVLVTNATGLHFPQVEEGLKLFAPEDEVWAKLEAGTQEYMWKINNTRITLKRVLDNILRLGRKRPVIIQSLFCTWKGEEPSEMEIDAYVERLLELKNGGAEIPLVQVYSAVRPPANPGAGHLSLKTLSGIARKVREVTGLRAEVF